MIYPVIDFFKSRLGQMLILSAVVIVVIMGVGSYHQKKEQEALAAGVFPRASEHPSFDQGKTMRIDGKDVYGHVESNPSFESFNPPKEIEEESETPFVLPMPNLAPQPQMDLDRFQSLSVLIASERNTPTSEVVPAVEIKAPTVRIKRGALLYCQLNTPLSSNQGNAEVQARLTKPYLNRGRLILPSGTRLKGRLQNGKGNRLYFAEEWQAELPSGKWISLSGQVQQKAFNASTGKYLRGDGLAGLPGFLEEQPKRKSEQWLKLLSVLGSVATGVVKDETRKAIGYQIPDVTRNILLDGGGGVIKNWEPQLLENNNAQSFSELKKLTVAAGTEFYLMAGEEDTR